MKIDWQLLALVAVTTTAAAIAIVGIFSIGVLTPSSGTHPAGSTTTAPAPRLIGYSCLTLAGLFVLYGLYLIIPQFH